MSLTLTWIGHATAVLDLDGARLVTDPLLHSNAGLLRRSAALPEVHAWVNADAVLLSHLHHDHAEPRSLRRFGPVPVLTATANVSWVRQIGLQGMGLGPDDWFPVTDTVRVRLAPAVHESRRMPHRPNGVTGHLVSGPSGTVWFAGDTELFDGLSRLEELAGTRIDLALVPVHGWAPRLSGGHMGPVDAARACALVGARRAVPVHWGTLHAPAGRNLPRGWMDRAGRSFAAAAHRLAPRCEVRVLLPGESWHVW